ncbi:MAG: serine/threonine-protein kinase [Myxococcota bacterium]
METSRWRRVSDVLDQALELEPAQVPAFLAAACAGDPTLKSEVEALLRADAEAGGFLATPAPLAAGGVVGQAREGDRLGAWTLERLLGEGGMGRVFLATRSVGDAVQRGALKVLAWSMSSEARRRFLDEQRLLASLEHPGIARFLDAGIDDDVPWLVMEVVEGVTLTTWSRDKPLRARLQRFVEVCDAVQAAHRRLVVHRDLKPSNVLVTPEGHVKLLDFGIARELDSAEPLTRTEARVLTPEYAAPEQIQGGPVTTAIDVWGLGVLLHEVLTGEVPWPRGPRAAFSVQQAVLSEEPPRVAPRVASLGSGEEARDLEGVVWKALSKQPERRYPSAEALAADVRRVLDGEPVEAREHTALSRALRFLGRHKAGSLTSLAFVVTLGTGAAATWWQAREAKREAARAQAEAAAAKAARDFVVSLFTEADPAQAKGADVTAKELLERGAARIDTELAGQPELQEALWKELAAVNLQVGAFAQGEAQAKKLVAACEARYGPTDVRVAEALVLLAENQAEDGRVPEAEPNYARALAIVRQHGDVPVKVSVEARRGLALAAYKRGEVDEAQRQLEEALVLAQDKAGPTSESVQLVASSLTRQLIERRLFDRALPYARLSLDSCTARLGLENPATLVSLFNLAVIESEVGLYAESAKHLSTLRPLQEKLLGPSHPNVLLTLRMVARLAGRSGRADEADAVMTDVVARLRAEAKGDSEAVAYALLQWDGLRRDAGRPDGAKAKEAQAILERVVGPAHGDVGWALSAQAADALARGALAEADTLAKQAEPLQRPAEGAHDVWHAETVNLLGRIAFLQGRRAEALALHRRALASLEALGAVDAVRWRTVWQLAEAADGPPGERVKAMREAVAKLEPLFPDGHPQRTEAVLALAKALRSDRPDEARALLDEEARRVAAWGPNHPLRATLESLRGQ